MIEAAEARNLCLWGGLNLEPEENTMPEPFLFTVFGGTGFLGGRVAEHFLPAGHRVRIAARQPDRKPEIVQSERAEAFYAA